MTLEMLKSCLEKIAKATASFFFHRKNPGKPTDFPSNLGKNKGFPGFFPGFKRFFFLLTSSVIKLFFWVGFLY